MIESRIISLLIKQFTVFITYDGRNDILAEASFWLKLKRLDSLSVLDHTRELHYSIS